MISNDQWIKNMKQGVLYAYLFQTISIQERRLLESSIDAEINELRMNRDSEHRLRRNK